MDGVAAANTEAEHDLGVALPAGTVAQPIRDSIQTALDQAMPDGPTAKTRAIVAVVDPAKGLQFGLAVRFNRGWELHADVERDWSGPVSGKVVVMRSW